MTQDEKHIFVLPNDDEFHAVITKFGLEVPELWLAFSFETRKFLLSRSRLGDHYYCSWRLLQ
jgi:hypothetical protein